MIGQTISHYEILEKLDEGGMGVVYKARDTLLERPVAIKFLSPQLQSDPRAKARFVHEARAASALNHNHIATVHEIAETDDGRLFMVMAYYEGESLRDKLDGGPLGVDEALQIVSQVASGLAKAHEKGILHRDIKPANILVTDDGDPKLADFGLAKLKGATRLTKSGSTLGTIEYMSPEQLRGDEIDDRSDVYSLGVVLYELLTGDVPFRAEHEAAIVYSITSKDPQPVIEINRRVPESVSRIVDRMMEKDPTNRYQSVTDLMADLNAVSPGTVPAPRGRARYWRTPLGIATIVTSLVAVAAAAYFVVKLAGGFTDEPPITAELNEGTFTIAVAPFWGPTESALEEGRVMQTYVETDLAERFAEDEDIRVLRGAIDAVPRSDEEARALAKQSRATMLLWGDVLVLHERVTVQPQITVMTRWRMRGAGTRPVVTVSEKDLAGLMKTSVEDPDPILVRRNAAREVTNAVLVIASNHMFFERRERDRAVELLERVDPMSPLTMVAKAWVLLARARETGDSLLALRDYPRAESLATAAIRMEPSAVGFTTLGLVQASTERLDAALSSFMRAVEIEPQYPLSYFNIGVYYYSQRDPDEALKWYRKCLDVDSTVAIAYMYMGFIYDRKRNIERSVECFHAALAVDSMYAAAHWSLAFGYRKQQRYDEAIAELKKALEINPEVPMANLAWGFVYHLHGDYEKAIEYYEAELALHPRNAGVYITMGHLYYYRMDQPEEAIVVYERALRNRMPAPEYFHLLLGISRQQTGYGDSAWDDLRAFAATLDPGVEWGHEIVRFYADLATEDEVLAMVGDAVGWHPIEMNYFMGMAHLLGQGTPADTAKAVTYLERCVELGLERYDAPAATLNDEGVLIEYMYAERQLRWLGRLPPLEVSAGVRETVQ